MKTERGISKYICLLFLIHFWIFFSTPPLDVLYLQWKVELSSSKGQYFCVLLLKWSNVWGGGKKKNCMENKVRQAGRTLWFLITRKISSLKWVDRSWPLKSKNEMALNKMKMERRGTKGKYSADKWRMRSFPVGVSELKL